MPETRNPYGFRMVVARGNRVVKAAPIPVCCLVAAPSNAQSDTQPAFGSTANVPFQHWVWNRVIPAFTVPAATGGDGTLTYTATGLPAGVAMAASRRVAGTPTGAQLQAGTAIVTARDTDGDTATLTFPWTVEADTTPSFGTTTVPDQNWVTDKAIAAFTVPAASGGNAPLMHAIRGLPAGVMMMESREITGTPTTAGSGTATVAS